jgi:hypothetical protein
MVSCGVERCLCPLMLGLFFLAEIIMYDNVVAVYKSAQDVYFYVLGGYDENELILLSALTCLFDALSRLLRCVHDCGLICRCNRFALQNCAHTGVGHNLTSARC